MGGAEISVRRTAEGLVKAGHEVSVITTSPNGKRYCEEINGVKVYRVNFTNICTPYTSQKQPMIVKSIYYSINLWSLYSYIAVKSILKKENPDVVHVNNFKGLSLSVFSAVKRLKFPLIFTAHDYSLMCPGTHLVNTSGMICSNPTKLCKFYVRIQKFIVNNKIDVATAPSQFVIDKLKDAGFLKGVETIKLPLGIELNDESIKIKKSYAVIDILYVGGLTMSKGVHILINAFKELESENIRLHIVGKGVDGAEFKKMAGSDQRIVIHGFVSDEELMRLYQKANITIVPSIWYDNSPMVIYESLMNRTPVIGSRIGGIPELIRSGYNGFLFEAGNTKELKVVLDNLIGNSSELKRLEDGAFESVKKYTIDEYIKNLEGIYNEI